MSTEQNYNTPEAELERTRQLRLELAKQKALMMLLPKTMKNE